MQENVTSIAFHETMEGPFALGETDPHAGAEAGKTAGTTLSIGCSITIRDLDRFMSDPDHQGDIIGHVSFATFGENIPAKSGMFKLFSATDNPTDKRMVYELAFTYSGQDYYLIGRKNVRHDCVYDLWRDTTTLYTTLHQSTNQNGSIVGAGILTIDIDRLMKLIRSMQVIRARSTVDKVHALLQFGRFFFGELWAIYGAKASSE